MRQNFKKNGFILISVLIFLIIVAGLGAVILAYTFNNRLTTQSIIVREQLLFRLKGGFDFSSWLIEHFPVAPIHATFIFDGENMILDTVPGRQFTVTQQ